MKIKFIFNLFLISISLQLLAQAPAFSWVKQSTSNMDDSRVLPYSASIDKQNNNIVTGIFYQNATFGSVSFVSEGGYNSFISKMDSQGNFIWSKQLSSSAYYVSSNGVSTDNSGNIYIAGSFSGNVSFDSVGLTAEDNVQTSFIAKMDSSGNFIWAKKINNSGIKCVKVDSQGTIIIFGEFSGQLLLGNFNLTGIDDYFVAKLDPVGNPIWLKGIQNPGQNYSYKLAITTDSSDNIFITSSFREVLNFGDIQLSPSDKFYDEIFVCKMDSNGNFTWAKAAGGDRDDYAHGIGVDDIGNVYISGATYSESANFGSHTITNEGETDIYISKLNNNGEFIWAKSYGSPGDEMLWTAITDKSGNSYLAIDSNLGNYYSYILKYDSNGNLNWNKKLTNSSTECLVLDSNENLFVSGNFAASYSLDGFPLVSTANTQENAYFGKINNTLSVEEINKTDIQIYPNPTKDILNIINGKTTTVDVSIYDVSGKRITTKKTLPSKTSLDISSFDKGIYIIEVETETGKISKKIIKI